MKHQTILILFTVCFSFSVFAEVHRDLSVLPQSSPQRTVNDLQIVSQDGVIYRKSIDRDGIQLTIRDGKSNISQSRSYSDFVSKKACSANDESTLVIAFTENSLAKAKQACEEQVEGRVISSNVLTQTMLCHYSCKKVSLESIQSLFFEPFIEYIEPNVTRGI